MGNTYPPLIEESLTGLIRQTVFETHRYLGSGFLEVYENALANRLRRSGLKVDQQVHLWVHDEDGSVVGEYYADLIVNGVVLIELKATKGIAQENIAQLLNALRACRVRLGLLINFGTRVFEFRRFVVDLPDSVPSVPSVVPIPPSTG